MLETLRFFFIRFFFNGVAEIEVPDLAPLFFYPFFFYSLRRSVSYSAARGEGAARLCDGSSGELSVGQMH